MVFYSFVVVVMMRLWSRASAKTNSITIGGLFNVFEENVIDQAQVEHMHAFLMAVDEINAQSILLPDHDIKIAIRNADDIESAASSVTSLMNISDLGGVVSALYNSEAHIAISLLNDENVVTASSSITETKFGLGHKYPFNVVVRPLESFTGMVVQSVLCDMNISRLAIFSNEDLFGSSISVELLDGTYCDLEALGQYTFRSWDTNFDTAINSAIVDGASVFIFFLDHPEQIAKLLEDGFDQGLFTTGSQIFLPRSDFFDHFQVDDHTIADILHGSILLEYDPMYSVKNSTEGLQFLSNFAAASDVACGATDSTGYEYMKNSIGTCSNLTHADFASGGSRNMSNFAALSYDAMYTLAWGLHHAYAADNSVLTPGSINATLIKRALIDTVEFPGATGSIDVFEGMAEKANFAEGGRELGLKYRVENFKHDAYLLDTDGYRFHTVAMWSSEVGMFPCPAGLLQCEEFSYNTLDNNPPDGFPPFAFTGAPTVIKIGGLFAPFGPDGVLNVQQAEHMAAFLLAIEHVNNKSDGIRDDLLPNSRVVYAIENGAYSNIHAAAAVDYLYSSFYNTHVLGTVCSIPSGPAEAADVILTGDQIFTTFSEAAATRFGNSARHPYRASTVPLDALAGRVIQQVLCEHFNIHKVTVFHTISEFGNQAAAELRDGHYCDLELLSLHELQVHNQNFDRTLARAGQAGARAFVILANVDDAGGLLEKGYASGVFGQQTVVFLARINGLFDRDPISGDWLHFSAQADVPAIMKGVFAVQNFPDFEVKSSIEGQRFTEAFVAQEMRSTPEHCVYQLDTNHQRQLYRSQSSAECAELNFSEYRSGARSLSPGTANTYDATHLLLTAISAAIDRVGSGNVDAVDITDAVMDVTMVGATGPIDIFPGHSESNFVGKGNRESGLHYRLLNFNAATHAADSETGFATVGVISIDNGMLQQCPSFEACVDPVFNTRNNQPPAESKPTIYVTIDLGITIVLLVFGALVVVFCSFIMYMIYSNTNTRHIKNAQGSLMYFVAVGGIFGGLRAIVAALPVSTAKCTVELWLGHLSFAMIFGGMFIKSFRLTKIFKTAFKKVTITTELCVKYMVVGLAGLSLYLGLMTIFGVPHVAHERSTTGNQTTESAFCSMEIPQVQSVLYLAEFGFLVYGFMLCFVLKDIPAKYNESEANLDSIGIVCVAAIVCFSLLYGVNLDPVDASSVASLVMALVVLVIVLMLFAGKLIKIYKLGPKKVHVSRRKRKKNEVSTIEFPYSVSTEEEKFEWCNNQIALYKSTMLNLGRDDSSRSSRSGAYEEAGSNHSDVGQSHVHMHNDGRDEEQGKASERNKNVALDSVGGTIIAALSPDVSASEIPERPVVPTVQADDTTVQIEEQEAAKITQFNSKPTPL